MAAAFLQDWDVADFNTLLPDPKAKSAASRPASSSTAAATSQAVLATLPKAAPGAALRSSSEPPLQDLYKKELAMKELENMQLRSQLEQYKKAAAESAKTPAPAKELTERLDRLEQLIKESAQPKEPEVKRASGSSLSNVAPPSAASSSSGSGFKMTLNERSKQGKQQQQQQQQKRPRGGKHRVLRSVCMRCKLCLRKFTIF